MTQTTVYFLSAIVGLGLGAGISQFLIVRHKRNGSIGHSEWWFTLVMLLLLMACLMYIYWWLPNNN